MLLLVIMEIKLKSIGIAKNQEKKHFGEWKDVVTDLVIIRHIPQGKIGKVPEVGIFACRCPQRPNPIGISTTEIISIKDNTIKVKGLDVIDNTPILDIKPYTQQYDSALNAKVPEWVNKLDY